jgi:hypothetical protein
LLLSINIITFSFCFKTSFGIGFGIEFIIYGEKIEEEMFEIGVSY